MLAVTLPELAAALARGHAKLHASQVHTLLLGGLTSTAPDFSPAQLLRHIFGEGEATSDDLSSLRVVLDYWNFLVAEQDAGRVRFPPYPLAEEATIAELRAHATQRHDEIEWFIRGLLIGEDGASSTSLRRDCLEHLVDLSSIFARLASPDHGADLEATHLRDLRSNQLHSEELTERFMAALIEESEIRRQSALLDLPDDDTRVPVRRVPKIGRNEPCPCGSDKKYKRCCGNLAASPVPV